MLFEVVEMMFVGFCGYLVVKWQQTQFVGFSGEFLAVSGETLCGTLWLLYGDRPFPEFVVTLW